MKLLRTFFLLQCMNNDILHIHLSSNFVNQHKNNCLQKNAPFYTGPHILRSVTPLIFFNLYDPLGYLCLCSLQPSKAEFCQVRCCSELSLWPVWLAQPMRSLDSAAGVGEWGVLCEMKGLGLIRFWYLSPKKKIIKNPKILIISWMSQQEKE